MKHSVFMSLIFLTGCTSSQVAPIEVFSYEVGDNGYTLRSISEKKLTSSNNEIDSGFEEKINDLCPYGYLVSEPTEVNGSNGAWRKRSMEHYIAQRGGRKARKTTLDVCFAPITIKVPANKCGNSLSLYYVGCEEQSDSNEKLEWHLLTTESVTTTAQAQEIISYYEQRWLVEEFHKAWKSDGTDVEALQLQLKDNLERVAVIQAFIAIRLLQLRANSRKQENSSCESILPGICWKLSWVKQENKPLPSAAPD